MKKMKTRVMALFGALAMAAWGIGLGGCFTSVGNYDDESHDGVLTDGLLTTGRAVRIAQVGDSAGTIAVINGTSSISAYRDYNTLAEAFGAIGDTGIYEITLAPGAYKVEGLSYKGSATITIKGTGTARYGTDVLIYGQGTDISQESTRSTLSFQGACNVILENLAILNTHGDTTGTAQAEALGISNTAFSGTLAAYNCAFLSGQDTICTEGKAWFYKCYIEGDVDFLWMESRSGKVALYEECVIRAIGTRTTKAYFTAPRLAVTNTVGKGVVIWKSTLEAEDGLKEVYLGRNPWDEETDAKKKNADGTYQNGYPAFEKYYEQVAIVATKYYGNALSTAVWSGSGAHGTANQQFVGFKTDTHFKASAGGVGARLTAAQVSSEYSDRNAILNRVYNITEEKFENDAASSIWNIAAIEAAFGAGASGDLEQETFNPKSAKVVWDLASAWIDDNGKTSIQSNTQTGVLTGVVSGSDEHRVKMHINANANGQGGKFEAQPSNGRTQINQHTVLTVPVTDGSVVSVTTYNGSGTHGIEGTERDTYTHSGGATEIIIYCTGNGYLTEVAVSKLDLTALSDEQKNATATGSVRAIALDHKDFELMNGLSETVKATAYTSYGATAGSISWGTSDGNVATVSNGTVTAKADSGTAKITATCGSVSASCTVTATKAVAADLSKAEVTWDLKPSTINIQSSTGTVNGKITGSNKVVTATVDATNGGKLQGDGTKHAQFNSGTKITIPVSNGCTVTVTASSGGASYALYTIAGTPASTTNRVSTYTHSSGGNTIDIVSTGTAYLESIVITNLDATSLAKDAD